MEMESPVVLPLVARQNQTERHRPSHAVSLESFINAILELTYLLYSLAAVYSTMAIVYSALLLYQQDLGRYVKGSAAFELSW